MCGRRLSRQYSVAFCMSHEPCAHSEHMYNGSTAAARCHGASRSGTQTLFRFQRSNGRAET